jgi:hypothetical protein
MGRFYCRTEKKSPPHRIFSKLVRVTGTLENLNLVVNLNSFSSSKIRCGGDFFSVLMYSYVPNK